MAVGSLKTPLGPYGQTVMEYKAENSIRLWSGTRLLCLELQQRNSWLHHDQLQSGVPQAQSIMSGTAIAAAKPAVWKAAALPRGPLEPGARGLGLAVEGELWGLGEAASLPVLFPGVPAPVLMMTLPGGPRLQRLLRLLALISVHASSTSASISAGTKTFTWIGVYGEGAGWAGVLP